MAEQKRVLRYRDDKPVPYSGRRRVKKRRQVRLETVPEGWEYAMNVRIPARKG